MVKEQGQTVKKFWPIIILTVYQYHILRSEKLERFGQSHQLEAQEDVGRHRVGLGLPVVQERRHRGRAGQVGHPGGGGGGGAGQGHGDGGLEQAAVLEGEGKMGVEIVVLSFKDLVYSA